MRVRECDCGCLRETRRSKTMPWCLAWSERRGRLGPVPHGIAGASWTSASLGSTRGFRWWRSGSRDSTVYGRPHATENLVASHRRFSFTAFGRTRVRVGCRRPSTGRAYRLGPAHRTGQGQGDRASRSGAPGCLPAEPVPAGFATARRPSARVLRPRQHLARHRPPRRRRHPAVHPVSPWRLALHQLFLGGDFRRHEHERATRSD